MHRGNDSVDGGRSDAGAVSLATLARGVQERLAEFDPTLTPARDCLAMVRTLSELEHSTSAALALAAHRVAQTDLWSKQGDRSAAHWLARVTGTSVADGVMALQTAENAEQAPATRDAWRKGKMSMRKGHATGKAEKADPKAGAGRSAGGPDRSVVQER